VPFFAEDEILLVQVRYGAVAGVEHLGVDAHQGYVTLEDQVVVAGRCDEQVSARATQQ
jgi:hypothetical protein